MVYIVLLIICYIVSLISTYHTGRNRQRIRTCKAIQSYLDGDRSEDLVQKIIDTCKGW